MHRRTSTLLLLALVGLSLLDPPIGYGMSTPELQEHIKNHVNERMYDTCKTVVLAQESNNAYRGYIEFLNGVRDDIEVNVSGEVVEYALARPGQSPAGQSREDVQARLDELQATVHRLQAEIARLSALCRQAGVDPEPAEVTDDSSGVQTDDTSIARSESLPFTSRMYDEIQKGMTYRKVMDMLGAEGDRIGSSRVGDVANEIRVWVNPDDSHICIVFQNGSVLVKTQADLPEADSASGPSASEKN